MSSTLQALPPTCAAIARIWPTVTTPVPPIPVTRTPKGSLSEGNCGALNFAARDMAEIALPLASFIAAFFGFFSCPPSTVTKLGQKPVTQEKSLLQLD